MTKVLLVRHGHVEGILPERFRGRADLALTAEGRRQAEATARRIQRSWKPAALYSSPLARCIATAAAIGKPFVLTPIPLPALTEIDHGQWQGPTPEEVGARWPDELAQWYRHPDRAAAAGLRAYPRNAGRWMGNPGLASVGEPHPSQPPYSGPITVTMQSANAYSPLPPLLFPPMPATTPKR